MMADDIIVYDFDGGNQAIANGCIGTIHQLVALLLVKAVGLRGREGYSKHDAVFGIFIFSAI